MAKLVILSGEFSGKPFDLVEERITLGRSGDNAIRVDDKTVSSRHATLTFDGRDYVLKDLNSTNGTRVNGRRVNEAKLSNGDHVRLGSVELRFESEKAAPGRPLPPPSTGIDLTTITPTAVTPVTMGSASPFPRRENKTNWVLNGIIAVLVILAVGFLVALIFRWSK